MAYSKVEEQGRRQNATAKHVAQYIVDSEADLSVITSICLPGSVAYTADLASLWVLAADAATWTSVQ